MGLTVDVGNHKVECGADGNKVCNHIALTAEIHNTHEVETGALEMHTIGSFLAVRFDVDAKRATAGFDLLIPATSRKLDEFGHLGITDVTFGNTIDELLNDFARLLDFTHTHHITCIGVASGLENFLKLNLIIASVRMNLTTVACPVGAATGGAGNAIVNSILL